LDFIAFAMAFGVPAEHHFGQLENEDKFLEGELAFCSRHCNCGMMLVNVNRMLDDLLVLVWLQP
jgi:hypothetical protein